MIGGRGGVEIAPIPGPIGGIIGGGINNGGGAEDGGKFELSLSRRLPVSASGTSGLIISGVGWLEFSLEYFLIIMG